jgi:hypothetical protein
MEPLPRHARDLWRKQDTELFPPSLGQLSPEGTTLEEFKKAHGVVRDDQVTEKVVNGQVVWLIDGYSTKDWDQMNDLYAGADHPYA